MHRSITPLSYLLIATMLTPPVSVRAEEASTATTVLQGVNSALGSTNNLLTTIQSSNAQMNQLYGQFTSLGNQQNSIQSGLGAIEQTKQELALALATAQSCVSNAETKKNGKISRYKRASIQSATAFLNAEPTCENYGNLMDSGRRLADLLTSGMEKTACMMQLQNTMTQVANKAKTAFVQTTQAANEVYNTRTSIIDNYDSMAQRINKDLNGGEGGDGGYKKKLADLKALSASLYQEVNAGLAVKDGKAEGGGFGAKLRMAKAERTQAANTWYKRFLLGDSSGAGDVQQCFENLPSKCNDGSVTSPMNCIGNALSSGTTNGGVASRVNVIQRSQGADNVQIMKRAMALNVSAQIDANRLAKLDITNSDQFLNFTRTQFDTMVSKMINNVQAQTFRGKVDKAQVVNFMKQEYERCYQNAVANFKSDIAGEGGQYKAALRAVEEKEAGLTAEIKGRLDDVQGKMNEFRTSFNKIYNADLPQFSSDCAGSDDPYQSLDCLRMLSANLKSGIEGTSQSVKLDNKLSATGANQFTAQPPTTVMNMQTLTIDPTTMKPTLGTATTSCVGFNECINVMERSQKHYEDQKTAQTTARKEFVTTNNKSMETSLGTVAAQFTQVGTLFSQEVEKLNKEMTAAGVTSILKTKQAESEPLTANKDTGLYEVPKDMKGAIASQGSFTELDSPNETQTDARAQFNEIQKKVKDATVKKGQCLVKPGDYSAIANALDCSEANVCKGDRIGRLLNPLATLLHKSSKNPDASERNTVATEYNSCLRSARSAVDPSSDDDKEDERSADELTDSEKRERAAQRRRDRNDTRAARKEYRESESQACATAALGQLDAKVEDSVSDSVKSTNSGIMSKVRAVIDACPDKEAAVNACTAAQSSIKAQTPPDSLDTKVDESSGGAPTFTNQLNSNGSAK